MGEENSARLISSIGEFHQNIKCVSWYLGAKELSELLLAVGLINGKIAITNILKQHDVQDALGKEYGLCLVFLNVLFLYILEISLNMRFYYFYSTQKLSPR